MDFDFQRIWDQLTGKEDKFVRDLGNYEGASEEELQEHEGPWNEQKEQGSAKRGPTKETPQPRWWE